MKLRKHTTNQAQEWQRKNFRESFKFEPMDIPFLMISGFTFYVIVDMILVSIK